jgi:GNAT superfamily N-acetyltransferase
MNVVLRPFAATDVEACGTICYHAFKNIAERHGFNPDLPTPEMAIGLIGMLSSHPNFHGVVAEHQGKPVGSNFIDERGVMAGVGPVTVDPGHQDRGVGRQLMEYAIQRSETGGKRGIRLTQAAYHSRSLSLYAKLGFAPRESLCVVQGATPDVAISGRKVRAATVADLGKCNAVCQAVHGHDRAGELTDAVQQGSATVVERDGAITGYATLVGYFGHAVAANNDDLKALVAASPAYPGPGFLLPASNAAVLRWSLENGLRVSHIATLMTRGEYQPPSGAYLPSILY